LLEAPCWAARRSSSTGTADRLARRARSSRDATQSSCRPDFGDQITPVRIAERQAFDIVALSAASIINEEPDQDRAGDGADDAQDVLLNVLELPEDKIEELRTLERR
jgi:hypothetical protein